MKERPILCSGEMVRALLRDENPKTQMRLEIKPQPSDCELVQYTSGKWPHNTANGAARVCPYGQPGDKLWVREAWAHPSDIRHIQDVASGECEYIADGTVLIEDDWTMRPSIHMPRRLSRITLEITEVRVQRLQDISDEDALAEGVTVIGRNEVNSLSLGKFVHAYRHLWNSINGPGAWDRNPWVWAMTFKRVTA